MCPSAPTHRTFPVVEVPATSCRLTTSQPMRLVRANLRIERMPCIASAVLEPVGLYTATGWLKTTIVAAQRPIVYAIPMKSADVHMADTADIRCTAGHERRDLLHHAL